VLNCIEIADEDDSIQKLQLDNYYVWSRRAKEELTERNCWNAIDPGFGDIVDDMSADQQRINRKAYELLMKHVAGSYVEDIGTPKLQRQRGKSWKGFIFNTGPNGPAVEGNEEDGGPDNA